MWRAAAGLGLAADAAAAGAGGRADRTRRPRAVPPPLGALGDLPGGVRVDRQQVHRALAEATDPDLDPDRRAWHRGHAAQGLDEAVANELEHSAGRARARGGIAAAAAFLERAAELTPDPARRGRRALAAAQAKFESGALDAARGLLALAEGCSLDDVQRALLARLRAQIVFALSRGTDAPPLLLDAAKRLEPHDAESAREGYLEALGATIFAGRVHGRIGPREVAIAARSAPPGGHPPRPPTSSSTVLRRGSRRATSQASRHFGDALDAFGQDAGVDEDDLRRWFWLPWLVAGDLWDDEHVARAGHAGGSARPRVRRTHEPYPWRWVTAPWFTCTPGSSRRLRRCSRRGTRSRRRPEVPR